jgi:hypothetical protein
VRVIVVRVHFPNLFRADFNPAPDVFHVCL